jgi:hypothetical protein
VIRIDLNFLEGVQSVGAENEGRINKQCASSCVSVIKMSRRYVGPMITPVESVASFSECNF